MRHHDKIQTAAARKVLSDAINVHGCKILLAGCFAAGTKLLTREGWRAVETLHEGDEVASRAEYDTAPLRDPCSIRPLSLPAQTREIMRLKGQEE